MNPQFPQKRILVVEDEGIIQKLCQRLLIKDFDLYQAGSVREGLTLMTSCRPDLLISDLKLPDGDGFDIVRRYKYEFPKGQAIIITGSLNPDASFSDDDYRCFTEILLKPFEVDEFLGAVNRAFLQ